MEKKALVVCVIVGFLGVLSTVLGFVAEGKRIKASQVTVNVFDPTECVYPSSPAFALGITAAIILLVAQIILSVSGGCFCCSKTYSNQSNSRMKLGLVFFIFSWITFVFAFLLLLGGASLNNQSNMNNSFLNNSYLCYVVKPGVFSGAAVLSFICIALGINAYLSLNSGRNRTDGPNVQGGGIAMGNPQVPPPAMQEPAFVHQDNHGQHQFK